MMNQSMLKDLLLISNPKVLGLCTYLNETALAFILPAFYIGLLAEFIGNFDFQSVAKRAVIAFLAIKLFTPIFVEGVSESLEVSSQLIKKYSPQNKFLTAYQNAKGESIESGKKEVWSKLTRIVKMLVEDPIVMVIFLVSYFAFFLLTQLYSLTYYLAIALIGLCAILSIFPITAKSLNGAVKTSLWCMLMPFVVAIILCLIGDSDIFLKSYTGGIVQNLESLIQLLIMTVILLFSPAITTRIMSDSGISHVAENLGQMGGMATLVGGASFVSSYVGSKAQSLGGVIHRNTTAPMLNRFKDSLSNKAQSISTEKGLGASIRSITHTNPLARMKSKAGDLGHGIKNTSFREKMILGTDSVMNRKENALAREARVNNITDSKSFHSKVEPSQIGHQKQRVPITGFKKEAGNFLRNREEMISRPKLGNQFQDHRVNLDRPEIKRYSSNLKKLSSMKSSVKEEQRLQNQEMGERKLNRKPRRGGMRYDYRFV